jgi:deazaflavin-dependent oxidoreductase (nitroreductase family)
MLGHVGRRSGALRRTVLEVVRRDPESATYTVASAFGGRDSHWFSNIEKAPDVEITVGARRRRALAVPLSAREGEQAFRDYASRHPRAWAQLFRLILGNRFDGSDEAFRAIAESVPAVDLRIDERT